MNDEKNGDCRQPLMAWEDLPLRVLTPGDFVRRVRP
jgi:hypothetical protein